MINVLMALAHKFVGQYKDFEDVEMHSEFSLDVIGVAID
jgi:hypothetical protein